MHLRPDRCGAPKGDGSVRRRCRDSPADVFLCHELDPLVDASEFDPLVDAGELDPLVDTSELDSLVDTGELDPLVDAGEFDSLIDAGELDSLVDTGVLAAPADQQRLSYQQPPHNDVHHKAHYHYGAVLYHPRALLLVEALRSCDTTTWALPSGFFCDRSLFCYPRRRTL